MKGTLSQVYLKIPDYDDVQIIGFWITGLLLYFIIKCVPCWFNYLSLLAYTVTYVKTECNGCKLSGSAHQT